MMKKILLITLISVSVCYAKLVSQTVAQVQQEVLTSRDVAIFFMSESILFSGKKISNIKSIKPKDKKFKQAVSDLILEKVTYFESKLFPVIKITNSERRKAMSLLRKLQKESSRWRALEVSTAEMESLITSKLLSKKFISFKAESSDVPITEQEAKDYFEQNKLKFGNLPYKKFAKEIKAHLAYEQKRTRLKDWFEILHAKYKVKRF